MATYTARDRYAGTELPILREALRRIRLGETLPPDYLARGALAWVRMGLGPLGLEEAQTFLPYLENDGALLPQVPSSDDGLRETRRNRVIGVTVDLYDLRAPHAPIQAEEGEEWLTICAHNHLVTHASNTLARSHLAAPWGWCHICAALFDAQAQRQAAGV